MSPMSASRSPAATSRETSSTVAGRTPARLSSSWARRADATGSAAPDRSSTAAWNQHGEQQRVGVRHVLGDGLGRAQGLEQLGGVVGAAGHVVQPDHVGAAVGAAGDQRPPVPHERPAPRPRIEQQRQFLLAGAGHRRGGPRHRRLGAGGLGRRQGVDAGEDRAGQPPGRVARDVAVRALDGDPEHPVAAAHVQPAVGVDGLVAEIAHPLREHAVLDAVGERVEHVAEVGIGGSGPRLAVHADADDPRRASADRPERHPPGLVAVLRGHHLEPGVRDIGGGE